MTGIVRRSKGQPGNADKRVLFVDDEEGVLVALQHMVVDTDLVPLLAASGAEALEILATKGPVALVLSDYRMPGMTGVDLLREVHKLYPKTRRLILSGYAETHAVMEAINEGHVDRFLAKPWDDHKLVHALVEAVGQYRKEVDGERTLLRLEERNLELERVNEELEEKVRTSLVDLDATELFTAHQLFERLPYALYGFDANGRLLAINELGRAFSDAPTPPAVGDPLATVLSGDMVGIVNEAIATGEPTSGTARGGTLSYDLEFIALGSKRCVMVLLRRL